MNRVATILRSELIGVERFDHPAGRAHRDPPEEVSSAHSLSFLERGTFDVAVGHRRWRLEPGMLFRTWPGLVYRCRHSEEVPADVCLTVSYQSDFIEEIQHRRRRNTAVVTSPTNRLAYLGLRLSRLAACGSDSLALETLAAELLAEAASPEDRGHRFRVPQLRWYAERIETARAVLESSPAEPHTLGPLARHAGISPFHFARVFRELVGVPPHRYLMNVRLKRAAERLRAGASVTETALDCGIPNLSHFIRLFRRAYGVPPSRYHVVH
jgi:AraC-like DNA-binding protein